MTRLLVLLALAGCQRIIGIDPIVGAPCEANTPIDYALLPLPVGSEAAVIIATTPVDLTGDGRLDLVVQRQTSPVATSFVFVDNTATGAKLSSFVTEAMLAAGPVAIADFDGDGLADVATATATGVTVAANTTAAGATAVTLGNPVHLAATPAGLVTGDLDGDGLADLVTWTGGMVTLWRNTMADGALSFTSVSQQVYLPAGNVADVRLVDLDGDRRLDLVLVGKSATDYTIWLAPQTSTALAFAEPTTLTAGIPTLGALLVVDFDRSGTPDLIFDNQGRPRVFLNRTVAGGAPTFSAVPVNDDQSCRGNALAVDDVDLDGSLDVIMAQGHSLVCVMLNTGGNAAPAFTPAAVALTDFVTHFGVQDVNQDGAPDLLANAGGATALMVSGSHCEPAQ